MKKSFAMQQRLEFEREMKARRSAAIASFVLGFLAFFIFPWTGLLGLILSSIAIKKFKTSAGVNSQPHKVFRIFGNILGIFALIISIIIFIGQIILLIVIFIDIILKIIGAILASIGIIVVGTGAVLLALPVGAIWLFIQFGIPWIQGLIGGAGGQVTDAINAFLLANVGLDLNGIKDLINNIKEMFKEISAIFAFIQSISGGGEATTEASEAALMIL